MKIQPHNPSEARRFDSLARFASAPLTKVLLSGLAGAALLSLYGLLMWSLQFALQMWLSPEPRLLSPESRMKFLMVMLSYTVITGFIGGAILHCLWRRDMAHVERRKQMEFVVFVMVFLITFSVFALLRNVLWIKPDDFGTRFLWKASPLAGGALCVGIWLLFRKRV